MSLLGTCEVKSPQTGILSFLEDPELRKKIRLYPYNQKGWDPVEMCLNGVQSIAIFGGHQLHR